MKENIVYEKAFKFAINIVGIYRYLINEKKEYVLSKQLLCSGTSIGANIKEAIQGQSTKDFLSKMSIALKEASETEYWLNLLRATGYFDDTIHSPIIEDCQELNRILISVVKTTRKKCLGTSIPIGS